MNDLLQLKGNFEQKGGNPPGPRNLPNRKIEEFVTIDHLKKIKQELEQINTYWNEQKLLPGALLSIEYISIIPKSNRIAGFLSKSKTSSNSSIVGAKFSIASDGNPKHVITHFVSLSLLSETIKNLTIVITIAEKYFKGVIRYSDIHLINKGEIDVNIYSMNKTRFVNYVVDSYYINRFFIDEEKDDIKEDAIVTLYNTQTDTIELLKKLDISISRGNMIGNHTVSLKPNELSLLKQKAPYLISMATTDFSKLTVEDFEKGKDSLITIPDPNNEPTIGVIDTLFSEKVYFSKWVNYKNMIDPNIETTQLDYEHGTAISSIIVDGPTINPELEDGCGRFRVRHFGVSTSGRFSSFTILKRIQEIITNNKDIKVWNLSLGSILEVNKNFISPEAAILDQIQYENDVIFVVAGTNNMDSKQTKRIGAPADSINSLVVNSVNFSGKPASYTRIGPVLSFFNKPDVSYYGGDDDKKIKVCLPCGEGFVKGTSFAAPWISRKMAYLIYKLGLSREVAKALLIDAASGWNRNEHMLTTMGYGIVPKRIEEIAKAKNDEIKFILSGTLEKHKSYAHNIPVPIVGNNFPYIARATLCYYPHCERNQGVDYTSSEFNIKFGRVDDKPQIQAINYDKQDLPDTGINEEVARENFRKWDNIKHIKESFKGKPVTRTVYKNKMWGIQITKKERDTEQFGSGVNYGIVITLKETKGVNRIEEFISQCSLRSWLVNRVNVEQRIEIYNKAEETIKFD